MAINMATKMFYRISILILLEILFSCHVLADNNQWNIYVFFGYPGAGKGTLSETLKHHGFYHISTGDLLRSQAGKQKFNKEYKNKIENGAKLLPNSIINEFVKNIIIELWKKGKKHIILDGFPKTISQDNFLKKFIKIFQLPYEITYIYLKVSPNISIERASNRIYCQNCKIIYNIVSNPPIHKDQCKVCGYILKKRISDTPSLIKEKINLFDQTTTNLIKRYQSAGKLITINANISIPEIKKDFLDAIQNNQKMEMNK